MPSAKLLKGEKYYCLVGYDAVLFGRSVFFGVNPVRVYVSVRSGTDFVHFAGDLIFWFLTGLLFFTVSY
jgi:hypothetical protein